MGNCCCIDPKESTTSPRAEAYAIQESAQQSPQQAAVGQDINAGKKQKKDETGKTEKRKNHNKTHESEGRDVQNVQPNRQAQRVPTEQNYNSWKKEQGPTEESVQKKRDRNAQEIIHREHSDRVQTNNGGRETMDTHMDDSDRKRKDEEVEKLRKGNKDKKKELQDMKKQKDEEIMKLKNELNEKEKELQKTKHQIKQLEAQKDMQTNEIKSLHWENTKKEESINSYKMQIDTLKEEKDSLLLRLSALAGAKLTDANPDLADLSDENRPTKLAEMYSELYDNEWTEAFEYLNKNMGYEEQKCTMKLLDILQICYDECRKRADKDLEELLRLATDNFCEGNAFPVEMKKTLKDSRKKFHLEIPKDLCEEIDRHLEPSLKNTKPDKVTPYVAKCRSLCWLMAIQDPPVTIEHRDNLKPGRKFDKNHYRYYTSSGDQVAYFVWPTLYIHDDGAVLCKGVAQGIKSTAKLTAPPEPQNTTASSWQQKSKAYPGQQNSPGAQGARDSVTSSQKKPLATSLTTGGSKTSSTPHSSTEHSQTHYVSTSIPKEHEVKPLKQHELGKTGQRRDELNPKQSNADPAQGMRHQSQQDFKMPSQDSTKPNKPSGGHVGQSLVVRSTDSFEDKKPKHSSLIAVKKTETHF